MSWSLHFSIRVHLGVIIEILQIILIIGNYLKLKKKKKKDKCVLLFPGMCCTEIDQLNFLGAGDWKKTSSLAAVEQHSYWIRKLCQKLPPMRIHGCPSV